jgi:hypothetical protein
VGAITHVAAYIGQTTHKPLAVIAQATSIPAAAYRIASTRVIAFHGVVAAGGT